MSASTGRVTAMLLPKGRFVTTYFFIVVAPLIAASCETVGPRETPPSEVVLANEYIEVHVDAAKGYFYLRTTGGDPQITTDSNKLLLYYGKLATGAMEASSRTFLQIDRKVYRYGDAAGMFEDRPRRDGDSIVSRWRVEDVSVQQTLRIVKGPATGNPDTIMIEYAVSNQGGRERSVGLKLLLDTLLGDNDGAPFSLADKGTITREVSYEGDEIPDFWYATDSLSNPTVKAQGTLKGGDLAPPGRIVFAHFNNLSEREWDYNPRPDFTIKDSAVLLYWSPAPLTDKPRRIATSYGIYGLSERSEIFGLEFSVPDKAYFGGPFTVSAQIKNAADFTVPGVKAGLSFSKDGSPVKGEVLLDKDQKEEEQVGDMEPGEVREVLWKLSARERLDGVFQAILRMESGEIKIEGGLPIGKASSRAIKEIRMFGGDALSVVVSSVRAPRVLRAIDGTAPQSFEVSSTIMNDGTARAESVRAILLVRGRGDDLLLIVDDPIRSLGSMEIGEEKAASWKVNYPERMEEWASGELSYSIVVTALREGADPKSPAAQSVRSGTVKISSGGVLADIGRVNKEIKELISRPSGEIGSEEKDMYLKRLDDLRKKADELKRMIEKEEGL